MTTKIKSPTTAYFSKNTRKTKRWKLLKLSCSPIAAPIKRHMQHNN
jgi:hypothetical protein